MRVKIQLLHPPGIYHARNLSSLTPSLPLGLAYVAAALEKAGFPVGVIDAIGEAPTRVEKDGEFRRVGLGTADIIRRIDPDTKVIGISIMFSFLWPATRELLRAIRAARPDVILVGGGEHFTGLPEYSMAQAPIDFIVMGEGEEIVVELMHALAAGRTDHESIAGLAWRQDGEIRINPRRARHRDVDETAASLRSPPRLPRLGGEPAPCHTPDHGRPPVRQVLEAHPAQRQQVDRPASRRLHDGG